MDSAVAKEIVDGLTKGEWPAVVALSIILFRKQIRGFLDKLRGINVEAGGVKLQTSHEEAPLTIGEITKTELSPPDNGSSSTQLNDQLLGDGGDTTSKPHEGSGPVTAEDLRWEMFASAQEGNIEDSEQLLRQIYALEPDNDLRVRSRVVRLVALFKAGHEPALSELEELSKDPQTRGPGFTGLANCYEYLGQYERAAEAFLIAADQRTDPERRARERVSAAICLQMIGRREDGIKLVTSDLSTDSGAGKHELYLGLAALLKETDDDELCAISLERASDLDPSSVGTHFDAGYSYSQSDYTALAILHYLSVNKLDAKHANALNNLGVAFQQIDALSRSVKAYKQSIEYGNTLAAANLSYRYMDAGFVLEAKEILDKAKLNDDMSANVGSALARLSNDDKEENKTVDEVASLARRQQAFMVEFAKAYFESTGPPVDIVGKWRVSSSDTFDLSGSSGIIDGKGIRDGKTYALSGQLNNSGARISLSKTTYSLLGQETGTVKDGRALAYVSETGLTIYAMIIKSDKYSFATWTKVE